MAVAAAEQDVGLNTDAQHFLNAMLRGLGFEFARGGDVGNQRHVDKSVFSLPSSRRIWRMASRKGRDSMSPTVPPISTMTTSTPSETFLMVVLDFVGDVGNDLHGLAEVIAAPLFAEDGFVNAAGGPVIVAAELGVCESLVMAEVQVGFRAVLGDEDFAVLKRAHGARVNVQVRIAFLQGDFKTATFEETADRGGSYAFSE